MYHLLLCCCPLRQPPVQQTCPCRRPCAPGSTTCSQKASAIYAEQFFQKICHGLVNQSKCRWNCWWWISRSCKARHHYVQPTRSLVYRLYYRVGIAMCECKMYSIGLIWKWPLSRLRISTFLLQIFSLSACVLKSFLVSCWHAENRKLKQTPVGPRPWMYLSPPCPAWGYQSPHCLGIRVHLV